MSVLGDSGVGSTDLEMWTNMDRVGVWPGARVEPRRARATGLGGLGWAELTLP